jgi:ribosome-associated protein
MLEINSRLRIPLREFDFQFSRSSGAGGQNVNKVNTKATLRWDVAGTGSLPEEVRRRFFDKFRRRINLEGELVMSSQRFRDQARNVAECIEKLRVMLEEVARRPKKRTATKPTRGSKERRLKEKHQRSNIKKARGHVQADD